MDNIEVLANLRQHLADMRANKQALVAELEAKPEYRLTCNEITLATAQIDELEKQIKTGYQAVATLDESGKVSNAKPTEWLTLKKFDTSFPKYEPAKAFEYCLSHFTLALKLDKKEFDGKVLEGKIPSEIAQIVPGYEIRAQIASDLSAYLSKE